MFEFCVRNTNRQYFSNCCLPICLNFAVPLRGRVCCHLFDTLFMPPAAHFVRTKCSKALRGHPLKSPCYGGIEQMHISHNGTPSKKHPAFAPLARSCIFYRWFLPLLRGAFFGAAAYRTPAKQGTPQERQSISTDCRRSVRAGQTLRLFRSARAVNRWYEDHLLKGGFLRGNALGDLFPSFQSLEKKAVGDINSSSMR